MEEIAVSSRLGYRVRPYLKTKQRHTYFTLILALWDVREFHPTSSLGKSWILHGDGGA